MSDDSLRPKFVYDEKLGARREIKDTDLYQYDISMEMFRVMTQKDVQLMAFGIGQLGQLVTGLRQVLRDYEQSLRDRNSRETK